MLTLQLHAAIDGYAVAFVSDHRRETLALFPTLAAAAGALRAAEAAASRISNLQAYYDRPSLQP